MRSRAGADAIAVVVDGTVVVEAGTPQGDAADEGVADGVVLRRWGGRPLSADETATLLAGVLRAVVADRAAGSSARRTAATFLGMASHEVKTPLTVVLGTLRLLQQHGGDVDAEQRDLLLTMAARRARDVARLLDGVLHTARARLSPEAGQTSVLSDVVADAVAGLEYGVDIDVALLPQAVLAVNAASARSIIGALLDDAANRATPVAVAAAASDGVVEVSVRNTSRRPADLRADPAFEPASPGPDGATATAALHLTALLARACGGELAGGVAGDAAAFTLRLSLA